MKHCTCQLDLRSYGPPALWMTSYASYGSILLTGRIQSPTYANLRMRCKRSNSIALRFRYILTQRRERRMSNDLILDRATVMQRGKRIEIECEDTAHAIEIYELLTAEEKEHGDEGE